MPFAVGAVSGTRRRWPQSLSAAHCEQRRCSVVTLAGVYGQGDHIPAQSLKIKHLVGQGSFGEVFEVRGSALNTAVEDGV